MTDDKEDDSPPERPSLRKRLVRGNSAVDSVAACFRADLDLMGKIKRSNSERSPSTGDLAFLSDAIYLSVDVDSNEGLRRSSSVTNLGPIKSTDVLCEELNVLNYDWLDVVD